jgi:protein-disulfide isomerase
MSLDEANTPKVPPTARSGSGRLAAIIAAPLLLAAGVAFFFVGRGGTEQAGTPTITAAASGQFSADQQHAIQAVVRDYLIANPEILIEVQAALEAKMVKEEAEKTKALVAANAQELYHHPNAPTAGNPDGDITVVEFFDYNCGYCKRGFSDVRKLVDTDKKVRVVFKEFPILSDESEQASKVALAAQKQGKYWEVHQDLIVAKGRVDQAVALKIAEKHGLDMEKLKADMASPEVKAEIDRVKDLAKKMGINGTPHFLVGDKAVGGAPENLYDMLEGYVTDLRKTGCSYC